MEREQGGEGGQGAEPYGFAVIAGGRVVGHHRTWTLAVEVARRHERYASLSIHWVGRDVYERLYDGKTLEDCRLKMVDGALEAMEIFRVVEVLEYGGACPMQTVSRLEDGRGLYTRFRHGGFSIEVGDLVRSSYGWGVVHPLSFRCEMDVESPSSSYPEGEHTWDEMVEWSKPFGVIWPERPEGVR